MLKNKLGYLLFLIIAGFFAVLYNEYFIGIMFLVAVLLPFVLLGIVIYSCHRIIIKLDTTTMVVGKDEYLNLTVYLNNPSIFPVSRMNLMIQYYNEFSGEIKKENIQVTLDQKSSQNVACQIISKYCGNLLFEVKSIKLYDYFLIWSVKKKIRQAVHIAVMPEISEIPNTIITENPYIMVDSDVFSEHKAGDDPSEIFGIREYREGDKPNRIHWKLSYKQEQLMIKEFSDPIKDSIVVLLDLGCREKYETRLQIVDGLLECAISVSYNLLMNEHIHKFFWYDQNEGGVSQLPVHNYEDSLTVMEAVLQTQSATNGPSIINGYYTSFQKQNDTHMIYITSVLNEEEVYAWADNQKGTFLYLFYIKDPDRHPIGETFRNLLKDLRIILYEIDLNNIKESIRAIGNL
ncbi:MAG: DUF58 domain-containing protein [Anaerocolumna sp.]